MQNRRWDWAGLKQIRNNVPVPIMADESVHSPHDGIIAVRENAVHGGLHERGLWVFARFHREK